MHSSFAATFVEFIMRFVLCLMFVSNLVLQTISAVPANRTESTHPTDEHFDDIVSTIASEFVFVVAGDHLLLPKPEREEDVRLHADARTLAKLLQKLDCAKHVYDLFNRTVQNVGIDLWLKSEDGHSIIAGVVGKVIEKLKQDPHLHSEYLAERDVVEEQPPNLSESHDKHQEQSIRKHTVFEVTPDEIVKSEKLLRSRAVKLMVLSIGVLKHSEESIKGMVAGQLRDYIVTAKAIYDMAENGQTRGKVQRLFEQAINEYVDKFDVMFNNVTPAEFFVTLRDKIEQNPQLKSQLEEFEANINMLH